MNEKLIESISTAQIHIANPRARNRTRWQMMVANIREVGLKKPITVVRRSVNSHLAEDLVQDAFMLLYQTLRSGKNIEKPEAWTMCVLHRAATRQIKERSDYEQLDETAFAQNWLEEGTGMSTVQSLLSCLSRREEEVLLLRLEAMKYREIADQLGISMTSVNTLLARALQKLQKAVTVQQRIKEGRNQYEKKPVRRAS